MTRGIVRRDVRMFPAFPHGPRDFYERTVVPHCTPPREEPERAAPTTRARNFVQCLPAFAVYVLPRNP